MVNSEGQGSRMHVIWRRPDGFHNACPADYYPVQLDDQSRLWLHKTDKDSYPFRISGGWEAKEQTKRLNNFANLLPQDNEKWVTYLRDQFNHSMNEKPAGFFDEIVAWLDTLPDHLKGDTWEVEILSHAIASTRARLLEVKADFLKTTAG